MSLPQGVWAWIDKTATALQGIERNLDRIATALEAANERES